MSLLLKWLTTTRNSIDIKYLYAIIFSKMISVSEEYLRKRSRELVAERIKSSVLLNQNVENVNKEREFALIQPDGELLEQGFANVVYERDVCMYISFLI